MINKEIISSVIIRYYPDIQAIYLFGTYETEYERIESDVDIALLLPVKTAKSEHTIMLNDCRFELATVLNKQVDLVNLRSVTTVFQNEIISTGKIICKIDTNAVDEFEMLTLSFYQKLNEERKEILEDIRKSGRVLAR
jgi:uncharacterized protein